MVRWCTFELSPPLRPPRCKILTTLSGLHQLPAQQPARTDSLELPHHAPAEPSPANNTVPRASGSPPFPSPATPCPRAPSNYQRYELFRFSFFLIPSGYLLSVTHGPRRTVSIVSNFYFFVVRKRTRIKKTRSSTFFRDQVIIPFARALPECQAVGDFPGFTEFTPHSYSLLREAFSPRHALMYFRQIFLPTKR